MQGTLFILSAPSGAGKTSLVKALLAQDAHIKLSVSHTTRPARSGEVDGVNYHFTTVAEFEQMLTQQAFVEHARVFGNYYGTSQAWLNQSLQAGQDVLLEIDWQGAEQIRHIFPQACSIFILPPSLPELRRRLVGRNQDAAEVIEARLSEAQLEMSHCRQFDYLLINDQFDLALQQLQLIVDASRLRTQVQAERHGPLLAALLQGNAR